MIRLREVNNRDVGVNLDIHISFSSVKYSRHSTFFSKISYLTTLSPLILLTLMLQVANLANTKSCKIPDTLLHGYSSERTQQELSNEYQHDRV